MTPNYLKRDGFRKAVENLRMKLKILPLVVMCALTTAFGPVRAMAQAFTTLYNFTNGTDGAAPQAGLLLSGNTLFGTASTGGTNISGTAFAVGVGGTGFSTLHVFTLDNPSTMPTTNSDTWTYTNSNDGTDPQSVFVLSGGTLYGTAYSGGTNGSGTVFALNTSGSGFNTLHTFGIITNYFTNSVTGNNTNFDGSYPCPGLVLAGNTLYGTTEYGGTNGNGTIFSVNTDGSGFTTLYSFTPTATNALGIYTNGDGASPASGLALCGSILYGTAPYGGTNGSGTVFAINTNGTGFATLYNFSATTSNSVAANGYTNNAYTNIDGAYPAGGLIAAGNTLYGTVQYGGANGCGTLFALNTNGTGFVTFHSFGLETYDPAIAKMTNSDGAHPQATLALSGNTLFGTAYAGGTNDSGAIFSIATNGTGFTTFYNFSQVAYDGSTGANTNADGAYPYGSLVPWSTNILFGTAGGGGSDGQGTVFAFVYGPGPIPLNFQFNGQFLTITWDDSALLLESAPTVNGPWTTIPGATSPYVVPTTNTMQFFQLVNTGSL
jgi:uncharacterized repeat protein (TIGR03803 family)